MRGEFLVFIFHGAAQAEMVGKQTSSRGASGGAQSPGGAEVSAARVRFHQAPRCARLKAAVGQASNLITVSLHMIIYDPGLSMYFQELPFELG